MERRKGQGVNVVIAEYIPSLNKGELLILEGMLTILNRIGEVNVYVFSPLPSIDTARYPPGVRAVDFYREIGVILGRKVSRLELIKTLSRYLFMLTSLIVHVRILKRMRDARLRPWQRVLASADLVIIGHDQVNLVFGFLVPFEPLLIAVAARLLGKPVIIFANGIYPDGEKSLVSKALSRVLLPFVLRCANIVTVRDVETLTYFRRYRKDVWFTGDPAILARSTGKRGLSPNLPQIVKCERSLLVGVALSRETLQSGCRSLNHSADRYACMVQHMAKLLDWIVERFDAEVVFIPHCIEPYFSRDDRKVHLDIYRQMIHKDKAVLLLEEYSISELKALLGKMDFLITSRVHAATNALAENVPVIGLTSKYDRRMLNLIGINFALKEWVFYVEELTSDTLKEAVIKLLQSREKIKQKLIYKKKLIESLSLINTILVRDLLESYGFITPRR